MPLVIRHGAAVIDLTSRPVLGEGLRQQGQPESPDDQWSEAAALCRVKAALKRCRSVADLTDFRVRFVDVVRKQLLQARAAACIRPTTVADRAGPTECTTTTTTCETTRCDAEGGTTAATRAKQFDEIMEYAKLALRQCVDIADMEKFLRLVTGAVRKEILCRASTTTTRSCEPKAFRGTDQRAGRPLRGRRGPKTVYYSMVKVGERDAQDPAAPPCYDIAHTPVIDDDVATRNTLS